MKANIIIILLLFSTSIIAQEALIINEVSSRNNQVILDEDGDSSDWIEIYNSSNDTIQLNNYFLSDDKDEPFMWKFPDHKLLPGEFILVFSSGKDRRRSINHWETPLNGDSLWKYLNPTEQSNYDYINWTEPDFNDNEWEWKRGGFGTGYENIITESSDTLPCIYLRNEFNLSDTSQVLAMSIHAYFDDGFTVFLNGYEIHREHMLNNGIKPAYSTTAFPAHPSGIDSGEEPEIFDIDPKLWKNLLKNGRNVVAIQNHNFWEQFPLIIKPWISLAMADSILQTQESPENLNYPGLLFHTNFKLNADGEKIYLIKQNAEIIQSLNIPYLGADISYGLHPDFVDSMVIFPNPTPGFENSSSAVKGYLNDTCFLKQQSGFYKDSVLIELINYDSLHQAFFTIDGSLPDTNSYKYDTAFYIDSTIVFRIQYFSDSLLKGPLSNYTYFINDSSELDIYSLITDPENLWNQETGIYAYGNQYWPNPPYFEANFWQKWERPVHIQFMSREEDFLWEQDAGIKIHGNFTRMLPQKSFGLYAKNQYGTNKFDHKLLSQKPYLTEYKRFLLRNAGNDNLLAHFRDLLIHKRMANTHVDVQQGYPVSTYLNGDYWGIYHLREKIDRFYLKNNQGVDPDDVNLLEQNALIIDGDRNEFENLIQYIQTFNLSEDLHYNSIEKEIDIENWIDLYIANLYHFNTDWPHHNSKFWNTAGTKWQQILVDLDVSMGLSSTNKAHKNPLPSIHNDSLSYLAIFYKALLQNNTFKRQYVNRFSDLMNTILLPSDYLVLYDSLKSDMQFEMQRHCERWNINYNHWLSGYYTQNIADFIEDRGPFMREFLQERYDLGTYDTIKLSVEPIGKGRIKLNTILVDDNNWQGLYFDSIPVYIEAIPNPGYEFIGWESTSSPNLADSTRILKNYYLNSFDDLKAVFYSETGIEDTLNIAITEINYRDWENAETGDWIEIHNLENDTIDLSDWSFKGLKPYKNWKIPQNTKIAPNDYLVLVQDTNTFSLWHPDVIFAGPFLFDLEEDENEQISLYDDLDRLVSQLSFSYKSPWPINSETANTIELINVYDDPQNAENWQLGCPGGSPGQAPQSCEPDNSIIITEINYNSRNDFETGDWIEIYNKGINTIDLSHWIIKDGNPDNRRQLPMNLNIAPGEYIIFMQDTSLFFENYNTAGKWFGPLNFGLSASGENIQLFNAFDLEVINITYSNQFPWPENAGNNGKSIELIEPNLIIHEGENWMANCFLGTPWNAPEWCIQSNSIWISEVKYQSAPDSLSGDWIELYNTNERPVDLMNWKFIIQGDTLVFDHYYQIPANDYVVLIADSVLFYSVYDSTIVSFNMGHFDLNKEEETISIIDSYKNPGQILSYHHLLNWPLIQSDTNNRTLELVDYSTSYLPGNWRAGCEFGTPSLPPSYCNTDGIVKIENELYFFVKPNPTSGNIQIELNNDNVGQFEIKLFDYQGNTILNELLYLNSIGKNTIPLNLQGLKSGVYLLQIKGDQESGQIKVIKIEE